uniref:Reverse transcriptase domain-containing protein n=1 Tax=Nelumbo nucifera TaxID=4432 RepID=A0A822YKV0_NELNU|nr:TPA_asm: hypothetical protein HUJ06_012071 [Nelumbo nucifera]
MPLGLTNAPATFCTLMNKIFHPYLDQFVVVYLDDIVVYGKTMEEHVGHLRKVFQLQWENQLYVKREKCSFAQTEVAFLGHKISQGKPSMDQAKVKAILDWEPPTKVTELRYCLGLANYYGLFIQRYSRIATPLIDLHWTEQCQLAFEQLKKAMTEEPMLHFPNLTKIFEVQTDALDYTIRKVLIQDEHPHMRAKN